MKTRYELMIEVNAVLAKLGCAPRGMSDYVRLRPQDEIIDLILAARLEGWNDACKAIAAACDKAGYESFAASTRFKSSNPDHWDARKNFEEQAVGAWRCKLRAEDLIDKCK